MIVKRPHVTYLIASAIEADDNVFTRRLIVMGIVHGSDLPGHLWVLDRFARFFWRCICGVGAIDSVDSVQLFQAHLGRII